MIMTAVDSLVEQDSINRCVEVEVVEISHPGVVEGVVISEAEAGMVICEVKFYNSINN